MLDGTWADDIEISYKLLDNMCFQYVITALEPGIYEMKAKAKINPASGGSQFEWRVETFDLTPLYVHKFASTRALNEV